METDFFTMPVDTETSWNLGQGLVFAREVEAFLAPHKYHVALGGSVLHKGYSTKDLDLYIYRHTEKGDKYDGDEDHLLQLLQTKFTYIQIEGGIYERPVFQFLCNGKRVDFITLF